MYRGEINRVIYPSSKRQNEYHFLYTDEQRLKNFGISMNIDMCFYDSERSSQWFLQNVHTHSISTLKTVKTVSTTKVVALL